MTAEKAYSIFKRSHSDLTILSCYEYESCFVFNAIPSEYVGTDDENAVFDSLFAIQKGNGALSLFTPFDISEEEYNSGKKLNKESFE